MKKKNDKDFYDYQRWVPSSAVFSIKKTAKQQSELTTKLSSPKTLNRKFSVPEIQVDHAPYNYLNGQSQYRS